MIGNSECEWDSLTEELGQDGLAVLFLQETVYFPQKLFIWPLF